MSNVIKLAGRQHTLQSMSRYKRKNLKQNRKLWNESDTFAAESNTPSEPPRKISKTQACPRFIICIIC